VYRKTNASFLILLSIANQKPEFFSFYGEKDIKKGFRTFNTKASLSYSIYLS
jgi:hypothetical protein